MFRNVLKVNFMPELPYCKNDRATLMVFILKACFMDISWCSHYHLFCLNHPTSPSLKSDSPPKKLYPLLPGEQTATNKRPFNFSQFIFSECSLDLRYYNEKQLLIKLFQTAFCNLFASKTL